MFSFHLVTAAILAIPSMSVPLPESGGIPVSLRECSLESIPPSLIPPFVSYLSTLPLTTINVNMGTATFRFSINGTCLQARVYNWSCDHILNVTGPGVANAVGSIADQCDGKKYSSGETAGPTGFGYYKDLESGYDFTSHLWVVSSSCTDSVRKSACSPGA